MTTSLSLSRAMWCCAATAVPNVRRRRPAGDGRRCDRRGINCRQRDTAPPAPARPPAPTTLQMPLTPPCRYQRCPPRARCSYSQGASSLLISASMSLQQQNRCQQRRKGQASQQRRNCAAGAPPCLPAWFATNACACPHQAAMAAQARQPPPPPLSLPPPHSHLGLAGVLALHVHAMKQPVGRLLDVCAGILLHLDVAHSCRHLLQLRVPAVQRRCAAHRRR